MNITTHPRRFQVGDRVKIPRMNREGIVLGIDPMNGNFMVGFTNCYSYSTTERPRGEYYKAHELRMMEGE